MTNGPETDRQAPGPVAFTRESYFRASVWTMVVVLLFLSPTFLVVFGWFLNGYQEATDAAAVSHRLHEVVFGMFFALALVGAISLLLRPDRSTAGLFQMAITLLTLFTGRQPHRALAVRPAPAIDPTRCGHLLPTQRSPAEVRPGLGVGHRAGPGSRCSHS